MRAFLILCVALFTLLTFYSALWFKSENIQTDITNRVTEDLNAANAKDVTVDVDGRHVTLSGVVYDEATETAYLDTANNTYGALGPIDGLTYLSGGGFVKAVKSETGIVLSGTVPTEDARDSLVAAAAASTEGDVTDNLSIGGSGGEWQAEAGYGVSKLADLSQGALAVSPGSYTLSGLAKDDGAAVQTDLTQREGWQAFVSSPAVEADLTNEVNRLKANETDLDQTITGLTSQRDTLTASLAAVNNDYKAVADARDAALAERDGLMVERDTAQDDLAKLRASLDDNQSNAASLATDLETATANIAARDATIEGLNGQVAELTGTNADLEAELAAQQAALSTDEQEVVGLKNKIDVQTATIKGLTADLDAKNGELTALQGNLGDLDATAAAANAKVAELTGELAQRDEQETRLDGQVADLTGKLANSQAEVVTLQGKLAEQSNGDAAAAARVAALTADLDTQTAQVDTLGKQVKDLTTVVAQRDETIASLQNAAPNVAPAVAVAAPETAQQCSARASQILEVTQINFSSGTANITNGSVPTLERLTGIAIACADSGLNMEIGGHTDSQGSDANNQALSERRANAIAKFMTDRGVPTGALKAVGYGEAKPIGDNATPAGRAKNRRISFEWQAR